MEVDFVRGESEVADGQFLAGEFLLDEGLEPALMLLAIRQPAADDGDVIPLVELQERFIGVCGCQKRTSGDAESGNRFQDHETGDTTVKRRYIQSGYEMNDYKVAEMAWAASMNDGKSGCQPVARSLALETCLCVQPRLRLRSRGPDGGSGRLKISTRFS